MNESELTDIERRIHLASPGPWKAYVEGRGDHWGGDDFIMIAEGREDDMYVDRLPGSGPMKKASADDLYFIAAARQDVPALLAEVRRLQGLISPPDASD